MQADVKLRVTGMTCGGCENAVKRALGTLPGVSEISASHVANEVTLRHDPELASLDAIRRKIESLGYSVGA
ncbi:MAG: heavy-metal-associated domain-containing protein [Acidobacteriota bacterium]